MKFTILTIITSLFLIPSISVKSQCHEVSIHCFNGDAKDGTQNGYDGIVHGATLTTDRNGKPNSAYSFDGQNDYIELPTTPYKLNDYSYSLWINISSIPSSTGTKYASPISIGNSGADQFILLSNNPSIGHLGLGGGSYNIAGSPSGTSTKTLPNLNTWYHLLVTRTNTEAKFYLNGSIVDSIKYASTPAKYNTPIKASIGARHGNGQFFHGKIDDIRIFDCALSASNVLKTYNAASCDTEIGLNEHNNKYQDNKVVVFPNPASSVVNFKFEKSVDHLRVHIIDVKGSLVQKDTYRGVEEIGIDVNLSPGLYYARLFDNQTSLGTHLIVIE